jgi:hypothetical protein
MCQNGVPYFSLLLTAVVAIWQQIYEDVRQTS